VIETIEQPQIKKGLNKLAIVGFMSLLMCASGYFSLLVPFLTVSLPMIYGRKVSYIFGLITLSLGLLIGLKFSIHHMYFLFFFTYFISLGCSEIALRDISPLKGTFLLGVTILIFVLSATKVFLAKEEMGMKEFLVSSITQIAQEVEKQKDELMQAGNSEDVLQTFSMLEDPAKLAEEILKSIPGYLIASIFFFVWIVTYAAFRSRRIFDPYKEYQFDELSLLNFKVPEKVIFGLILALVAVLFGDQLEDKNYQLYGTYLLHGFGVFYFFQGFGLYIRFLNNLKIFGFFRIMLIVITMATASWMIALVGLFDMFFNFNKFLNKTKV
jgi:hypothetical protein